MCALWGPRVGASASAGDRAERKTRKIVKLVNDFDEKCRSADAVLSAQLASLREFKDATFAACKRYQIKAPTISRRVRG